MSRLGGSRGRGWECARAGHPGGARDAEARSTYLRLVGVDISTDDVEHGLLARTTLRGAVSVPGIHGERTGRGGGEASWCWWRVEECVGTGFTNDDQGGGGDQGDCGSENYEHDRSRASGYCHVSVLSENGAGSDG